MRRGRNKLRRKTWTPTYACYYSDLVPICRKMGYALAVHGSLRRDLDVVAIPWTKRAKSAEVLIEAILAEVQGFMTPNETWPRPKPHGRLCWSIHLGGGRHIDLGIMPRV